MKKINKEVSRLSKKKLQEDIDACDNTDAQKQETLKLEVTPSELLAFDNFSESFDYKNFDVESFDAFDEEVYDDLEVKNHDRLTVPYIRETMVIKRELPENLSLKIYDQAIEPEEKNIEFSDKNENKES